VMDYALGRVTKRRDASGSWVTEATVYRRGEYRHRVTVGVRTASRWTLDSAVDAQLDRETVRIVTPDEPLEVRLDPFHFSWDWDRRDDVTRHGGPFALHGARTNFDWPLLDQADRERDVLLFRPVAWYSDVGGANIGLRLRGSHLEFLDAADLGVVLAARNAIGIDHRIQFWERAENPTFRRRPAMGWRMRLAQLDDIIKADIGRKREVASARGSRSSDMSLTFAHLMPAQLFDFTSGCFFDPGVGRIVCPPPRRISLVPELWRARTTVDLALRGRWQKGNAKRSHWFVEPNAVGGLVPRRRDNQVFGKLELALGRVQIFSGGAELGVRGYAAAASHREQRALLLNAADPISTFENDWWRPAGAILKRPGINWLPLAGAALRGFRWDLAVDHVEGGNIDASRRLASWASDSLSLRLHAFADVAHSEPGGQLSDAGAGLSVRGRLYDRRITVRLDSPFFVNRPDVAIDRGRAGVGQVAPRWVLSFNDIW